MPSENRPGKNEVTMIPGVARFTTILLLAAAACSDAAGPDSDPANGNVNPSLSYPAIAGTYDIAAGDGCCGGTQEGIIALSQPSLTSKSFSGTYSTRFIGPNGAGSKAPMIEGSVTGNFTSASQVQFTLNYPPNPSVTWTWTGTVNTSGSVRITGTWVQQAPDGSKGSSAFTLSHR